MKIGLSLLAAATLVACGKKDEGAGDTDSSWTTSAPVAALGTSVRARNPLVQLDPEAVAAHQAVNTVLGAMAVLASDTEVQVRLQIDNGPQQRLFECWTRPSPALSSFTIDFSPCPELGGQVHVNDTPAGPVAFEFSNFEYKGRTLSGTLALDSRDARDLSWQMYSSLSTVPSPSTPVPLTVGTEAGTASIQWNGGGGINLFYGEWNSWAAPSISTAAKTHTPALGGVDATVLAGPDAPGPSVISSSLDWFVCACPLEGVQLYDLGATFAEVAVDLDDLQVEDDGVDDPVITVAIAAPVPGEPIILGAGCGTYDVLWDEPDLTFTATSDQLSAGIQEACDQLRFADEGRCIQFLDNARSVPSVTVTVTAEKAHDAVFNAVRLGFDGEWCQW